MKFRSAIDAIGNTPLIELSRIYDGPGKLFAKMEFVNPGGSVKDRIAVRILQDAYNDAELKKAQPVVEMTICGD
ncbi:MAG: pyridoxal-phosphate dependent enzyme [Bdellovibrionales bacterium]|nr:pyridoxal-phosphate dependent enzyme [Bdellovibrionales bacterium]